MKLFALALAASAEFLTGSAQAQSVDGLITPIAVTAQSFYSGDDRAPVHAIDGSGMTPNSPVNTSSTCGTGAGGITWLSDGTKETWITFDLGRVQTITGFHLWNYNENSSPGEYQRGVQTAGIYAGTSLLADGTAYAEAGPAWGTLVEEMTFTQAPGAGAYAGEDYYFSTPVTTRYLQIYATSNFGFDAYTGISEIRFFPPTTMISFGSNVAGSSAVIGQPAGGAATIAWTVPYGTVLATLAPEFKLSSGTCNQTSGAVPSPNFGAGPVTYTVTEGGTINVYTVTVTVSSWGFNAWTGDADSGVTTASDYTVAVNCNGGAVTVNGVAFQADALSGPDFSIGGAVALFGPATPNVTGDSLTLAGTFIYAGSPRTVTLYNLTPGVTYETSLFAYGFEAAGRIQTFASGSDSLVLDQDLYGAGNGIRISSTFVADTSGSKVLTIAPGGGGTFHMSALANRMSSAPPAMILNFGTNVTGSSAVFGLPVGGAATIAWTVPYGTDLATLAPTFKLSSGTCNPPSGTVRNFGAGPVTYTVTDGGTINTYTVTATIAPPTTACDITAFNANFAGSSAVITTGTNAGNVLVVIPFGTTEAEVAALAPSYTLSLLATCPQPNPGIPTPHLSTTNAVHYIVTAGDGVTTKDYTVTVVVDGLIAPVAATAQSYYAPDNRAPVHTIDGSDMTPNGPVTVSSTCGTGAGGITWLSDGTKETWITFDLGRVQTITGFHLWNYNENSSPGEYQRGVQTAGIYAGTSLLADGTAYAEAGPAWGTLVEEMTFTMAPGAGGYAGEDYFFATPVTTRYLQIYATSNFGFDAYTGVSEIRFFAPATILSFGTNVARSSAVIGGPSAGGTATIGWTVPYASVLSTLAPEFTLSSGTCNRTSGTVPSPNFGAGPVTYTVTDGGTINTYTVTVTIAPPSTAKFMSNVLFPGLGYAVPVDSTGTNLVLHVASGTPVTGLVPTYVVSEFASGSPVSGTSRDFTTPQTYTVTAQDGSQQAYSVAVVALAAGQGYSALVLAAGPVAYWPLGEFTGTTAADITGHGHGGAYSGEFTLGVPGLVPLNSGAAVLLTNDATVSVPYSDSLNPARFTVEFWAKPSDLAVAYVVAMQDRSTGARIGYAIQKNNYTAGWDFTFGTGPSADDTIASGTPVAAGSVYHVVATYDGTAANLYVNGALASSRTTTYQPATPGTVDFTIGSRNGNTPVHAVMQHVAFYDRALTPQEIQTHFNGKVAPPVLGFSPNPDGTFTLTWTNAMLLEAGNVMGPWATNATAVSPLKVTPALPQGYYRLQAP